MVRPGLVVRWKRSAIICGRDVFLASTTAAAQRRCRDYGPLGGLPAGSAALEVAEGTAIVDGAAIVEGAGIVLAEGAALDEPAPAAGEALSEPGPDAPAAAEFEAGAAPVFAFALAPVVANPSPERSVVIVARPTVRDHACETEAFRA